MNRILHLFSLLVCAMFALQAAAYDFMVDGIAYNITDSSTVEVTKDDSYYELTSINILPTVSYGGKSYLVSSIGNEAFFGCEGLTSVIIPNSVTSIGGSAFSWCHSLTSVTIPNSVTAIGDYAFSGCSSLTSVSISNSLTSISTGLFSHCGSLKRVTIPNSVSSIGNEAFSGCEGLTSVTIPNSVTTIGDDAFSWCGGLTGVTIPSSVTSISNYTFQNCKSLKSVTIPNSVISIGFRAFFECESLSSVIIPNSVTSIGDEAFSSCGSLKSITIPSSLTSIGNGVFSYCTSLTGVTIPNSVTSIGNGVFSYCSSLTSVTIPNSVTSIGDYAFCYCESLSSVIIPNSVSSISAGLFSWCHSLTSVTIPNSVTSIGFQAFFWCTRLTGVTIPNSVTTIGDDAFSWCGGLTSVIIGNSVTSIGNGVFSDCEGLASVTIGNSVTSIGGGAFNGCRGLAGITSWPINPPKLGPNCFDGVDHSIPLSVSDVQAYSQADGWREFSNILPLAANTSSLRVRLPSDAADGRYRDMFVEVSSADGTMHNRCVITDKVSYSFNVQSGTNYHVAIKTAQGGLLGEKRDVEVKGEDVTVMFSSLLQPQTVSMAVTLPDGEDVTDRTTITWTDEQGEFLAQGKMLPGLVQGMKLGYELKLPQDLALQYVQPDRTPYQVKSSGNSILLKLQPFCVATISGTVRDASTSLPLRSSTVTVTQTLNGKQSRSFVAQTDNQGQFSLDALTAPGQLTVAAQGYVSRTWDLPTVSVTMRLDTLRLSPITGAVIRTDLTYRASVKQGETATTLNYYEDYANVSYTLRNKTRNRDITRFSVQFPDIVLLEDVNEGDEIVITAHSIKGVFNDAEASCVVHANRASVTLPLVELGGIEAHYTQSQAGSVVGMLYNSTGEQVRRDRYADATLSLAHVPDGRYTLVTMQASDFLNTVLTLGGLAEAGLKAGTDYVTSTVTVASGMVAEANVGAVPALDESKLYYTNSETRFTAGKSSVTIGNYITLTANVGFKSDYQSRVSDVQLVIDLPQGCDFVEQSLLIGNAYGTYYHEGNRVAVNLPNDGGRVKFCVMPTLMGRIAPSATVQFRVGGKTVNQPIGAANFEAKNLEINVPSVVSKPIVMVTGSAPFGSSVKLYDNGELIGMTTTIGNTWSANCTLSNVYNLSSHQIYAKATTLQGAELLSETANCLYDKSFIGVSKVTMFAGGDNVVFDFLNLSNSRSSYPASDWYTFTIDFTDNDTTKISNVALKVKTLAGGWRSLKAHFDGTQSCWVAHGAFVDNPPVNVAVSYDNLIEAKLCTEVYDAAVNYYSDTQAEFDAGMAEADAAIDQLMAAWDGDNYDVEAVAAMRHELLASLGVAVSDGSVGTYTDEQLEGVLAECDSVLADSLGLCRDQILQQSFEQISAMTQGITIGHCAGMTEAQLLAQGYEKVEKDDGTCIYILTNESTMRIADLANDVYYEVDLNSGNPLLAPIIELAESDDFRARMNDFCEKLKSACDKARGLLIQLADLVDSITRSLDNRNGKLADQLVDLDDCIKFLEAKKNPTLFQRTLLAGCKLRYKKLLTEAELNTRILSFIDKMDTRALRLGKIKIKGLTGVGRAGGLFAAFDLFMLQRDMLEDFSAVIDAYYSIPDPCENDASTARSLRNAVVAMGVGAGVYYLSQVAADAASISLAITGAAGAIPSGGTTLSAIGIALGMTVASMTAQYLYDRNFDVNLAKIMGRIKRLKCYKEPDTPSPQDDSPEEPEPAPDWHHSGSPDLTPVIDPSGFVYEAVPSNRLQGVTATIYYKETVEDMYGEPQEREVLWNAEDYAQQNPLFTDENGMYRWDVPQGMWQVRFSKTGYEPARSEWLPVPPPQLDVNICMTQLLQPEVAMVHAYKDGVELTFDKYMRTATLTTDNIAVTQSGKVVAGTVELMNEEQGDAEALASKVRFVPTAKFATDKPVTLTVKRQVESYAGVQMNSDFTQAFDIEKQVRVIAIDSVVNVGYGESRQVLVQALPVDIAKGKTLRVRSNLPVISDVENETYTLDKHGRANITVNGNLPGAATLTLSVDGFDLRSRARVLVVDEASLVTAKPVASVFNGKVFDGPLTVELSCETPGATIYYTTDGSCPCDVDSRKVYSGPITISETTTLKAIAVSPNHYESDIATYYYFYASGVNDVQGNAPFTIAPTLVTDGFKVLGVTGGCDVRLYSMKGTEVLHRTVVRSGELVPMSHLAPGVYIVVVTIDGQPYARRVVKAQ